MRGHFSCLKRTKTYTCSVMNDVGLGDLVTLYLNRERTSNINYTTTIEKYRKHNLLVLYEPHPSVRQVLQRVFDVLEIDVRCTLSIEI